MNWIMIAIMSGSLVVSSHETQEACEGRAAILKKDHKIETKCVEVPKTYDGKYYIYNNYMPAR